MDTWNIKTCVVKEETSLKRLAVMKKPPQEMWYVGDIQQLEKPVVCIVGTRKPSEYGIEITKLIVQELAAYDVCIVSGLAYGIDITAHLASLEACIPTIALPGSGLHPTSFYPQSHLEVAERIVEAHGLLLSAFSPHQPSAKWLFPMRNVYLAALAHAVIIVECYEESGTMYTAEAAVLHDIPCYAVPGSLSNPLSSGPHMLIHSGQHIFLNVAQLASDIGLIPKKLKTVSELGQTLIAFMEPSHMYTKSRLYTLCATTFPHQAVHTIDTELELLERAGLIECMGDTVQKLANFF